MNSKDRLLIISVALASGLFAFFIANFLFGGEKKFNLKAPTVSAITSDFKAPNPKYFNANAINPTQDITIGDQSNTKPFNQ